MGLAARSSSSRPTARLGRGAAVGVLPVQSLPLLASGYRCVLERKARHGKPPAGAGGLSPPANVGSGPVASAPGFLAITSAGRGEGGKFSEF